MDWNREIGEKIREMRKVNHKSLEHFAEELGIAKSTLQSIEHGDNVNVATLNIVTERLGTSVPELIGGMPADQFAQVSLLLRKINWLGQCQEHDRRLLLELSFR